MSCDKSKITPMCINCSRYRESILYGGHAACNKRKTIIKNEYAVCPDWKLSEHKRKIAIFWRMREIEERKAQEGAGK